MNPISKIQVQAAYKIYSNDLYRYAYSILKNKEDSLDVVQETFRKYLENRSEYRHECSLKTWLMTITRNCCYDVIKKKKIKNEIEEYPEQIVGFKNIELKIALELALKKLTPEENEVIFLRDYSGYSYKEIAEQLNISVENVKIKIFRTRKKLRIMLSEENNA